MYLPEELEKKYSELRKDILARLDDFANVPEDDYFYELCYCVCTPQSKAENAYKVELKLREADFLNTPMDPTPFLEDRSHYIRFHNQKAKRLQQVKENYDEIHKIVTSGISTEEKRTWLTENVIGFGMKESSHFLRNIGHRDIAILDRHVLKHLVLCGVYKEIPKVASVKNYLAVEKNFAKFAGKTGIPMDELDMLFWSYESGIILK